MSDKLNTFLFGAWNGSAHTVDKRICAIRVITWVMSDDSMQGWLVACVAISHWQVWLLIGYCLVKDLVRKRPSSGAASRL